ncbi:MAG: DUF11 domain-containing protein [Pseudomonadota bacterium]|nr:DUF11 domain-containing protein [Pseudomonadota bacterium]
MKRSPDRLFDLLPVVHRQRDAEQGYPLRALLQVIAEQVDVVEDDIDRLYENWFIETCEDWVVPYLGDLIGYQIAHEAGEPGDVKTERQQLLNKILIPRREVANTIRYRRRKGTLALLEFLAHDVAGWPARAVEFYQLLAWTQPLNHQRLDRGRSADLRDGDALDLLDGPFDVLAHTGDVRRLSSHRTRGRYNIPNVGLFVWRLRAYQITWEPAYCLEELGSHCYTFSVLGNDAPLFTKPAPEPSPEHIAGPLNVPVPIRRRALERNLNAYYGNDKSFTIWADGWAGHDLHAPLPPDSLVVADLSDWQYRPVRDRVAVDPVLGRLAFPPRQRPRKGVWVRYHYGFSDDLGGGEYRRTLAQPAGAVFYRVGRGADFERLNDALVRWRDEKPEHAVVEITDGGVYTEQINVELAEGQSFQLRATDGKRAVLRLMDWHTARPDALWVRGGPDSRFALDGLLVAGRSVQCEGPLAEVTIRHCTLVPGWSIDPDCDPSRPAEPSLELTNTRAYVTIERTILGSIQVNQDEVGSDPIPIHLSDSILDATSPEREAVGAPSWPLAHAVLTIECTTVFGEVKTHAIDLAENSIFVGKIHVARRQRGCMRFCYVTPGSRTPRRYRCQPDLAEQEARAELPAQDIGSPASAKLVVGEGGHQGPENDCAEPKGSANLQLTFEVSNPTPVVNEIITFTLTLANHGPRDATGIEVTITPPVDASDEMQDCLEGETFTVSQGEFDPGEPTALWKAGNLKAGGCAMLSAPVTVKGLCEPPAVTAAITAYRLQGEGQAFISDVIGRVRERVKPRFSSTRYGTPAYAQLALYCADEITRGADDESEMGAFHDLFQPQRAANLEARLDEFVPAGMDAGIIYAS